MARLHGRATRPDGYKGARHPEESNSPLIRGISKTREFYGREGNETRVLFHGTEAESVSREIRWEEEGCDCSSRTRLGNLVSDAIQPTRIRVGARHTPRKRSICVECSYSSHVDLVFCPNLILINPSDVFEPAETFAAPSDNLVYAPVAERRFGEANERYSGGGCRDAGNFSPEKGSTRPIDSHRGRQTREIALAHRECIPRIPFGCHYTECELHAVVRRAEQIYEALQRV